MSSHQVSGVPRHPEGHKDIYIAYDQAGSEVYMEKFSQGGVVAWHDENGEANLLRVLTQDPEFQNAKIWAYSEGSEVKPLNKKKYLKSAPLIEIAGLVRLEIPGTTVIFENDALTRSLPVLSVACESWEMVDNRLAKLDALHISGLLPQLLVDAGFTQ